MSIDPDLRIALGLILLLRIVMKMIYAGDASEIGILAELQRTNADRSWTIRCIWALFVLPLIAFLVDVEGLAWALFEVNETAAEYSMMYLPDFFRFSLLVPAVAGLLLVIWSYHSAVSPADRTESDAPRSPFRVGPFRIVRFPQWLGDFFLFGSLLLATANWAAVVAGIFAWLLFRKKYLPQAELAWQRLLGEEYVEYARCSGAILPRLPQDIPGIPTQYVVPKRFGLSAIIGLVTMFAVIFGAINLLQAQITEFDLSPTMHLFFGLELMIIWVGQMHFGQAPRRISTLVGAVLLPAFGYFSINSSAIGNWPLFLAFLFVVGGLIGYCLGAVAAGLFLVLDWVGSYLPSSRHSSFAGQSDSSNQSL